MNVWLTVTRKRMELGADPNVQPSDLADASSKLLQHEGRM